MTNRTILAIVGTSLALTACAEPAAPPVPPPLVAPKACNAERVQNFVGRLVSSFTLDEVRINANAQSSRLIAPGSAVSQDYRTDRVNVYVDTANVVARITCG